LSIIVSEGEPGYIAARLPFFVRYPEPGAAATGAIRLARGIPRETI